MRVIATQSAMISVKSTSPTTGRKIYFVFILTRII